MRNQNPGLHLHTTLDTALRDRLASSGEKLQEFQGKHTGERCVIIGNGPSLNQMDLSFLKNEITFGMNRIYLGFEKWGFQPSYYVSVNSLVLEQSHDQILDQIRCPKFISQHGSRFLPDQGDVFLLKSIDAPFFSRDISKGVWEGYTVTYVAMQIAFTMGFSEVVLIGVDHSFVSQGQPNQEVVANGPDINHFDAGYFDKGVRWHLPDLDHSEMAYRLANWVYQADGRQIIDATYQGQLQVYPKADYREIFSQPAAPRFYSLPEAEEAAPLVSLICPINDETELHQVVEQIKQQTYPNISPIFLNQSQNHLQPVLSASLNRQPYSYLYNNEWNSTAELLNTGLACAKGQFIAYFSPGVEYHPDHLAIQALTLKHHAQEQAVYSLPLSNPESPINLEIPWDGLTLDNLLVYPHLSLDSLMHRGSVPASIGGFDMNLPDFPEWDFLIRLFLLTDPAFIRLQTCSGTLATPLDKILDPERKETKLKSLYQKHEKYSTSAVQSDQRRLTQRLFGHPEETDKAAGEPNQDLETSILFASQAVEQGDLAAAADYLTHAISLAGFDPWLHTTRGNIHLARNCYPEAVADFSRVLLDNPEEVIALGGLATTLFMEEDFQGAEKLVRKALILQPDHQELQNLLAVIGAQIENSLQVQDKPESAVPSQLVEAVSPDHDLKVLQDNWETFGSQDPMWAILTRADKKGNRWQPGEFFETGITHIQQMLEHLRTINIQLNKGSALDFGCGYGRLTQAFAMEFDQVYGIDIAPSMIAGANFHNRFGKRCEYILNEKDDLSFFQSKSLDLIYSLITLQHIRPQYTRNYLFEFARILAPGGVLVFQLPSRRINQAEQPGSPARFDPANPVMEMHGIPKPDVLSLLEAHGVIPVQVMVDQSLGSDWESYRYFMLKSD